MRITKAVLSRIFFFSIQADKYHELEYVALRSEIEQSLSRRFQILTAGIFGVPTAAYGLTTFEANGFFFFIPFLVTALVMIFVAESNALMRCGA